MDMIKIGNVVFENNIFLAPMAGITDLAFRLVCKNWGAGGVFSEMVSAKAMHYNDKKTFSLMETSPEEDPLIVQIFGHEPHIMAESAKKIEDMGIKMIDINMGCPAPKVTSGGDGSALLKDFKLIGEIVKEVSHAVSIPVSCKIRCGIRDFTDVETLAKIIEDGGASAITVHGRTAAMYYSGKSDRSYIKKVKDAVSVPVIGNGDIYEAEDAVSMIEETGCDAVMVARGAQGNPFIFRQIDEYVSSKKVQTYPTWEEKLSVMKHHILLLCELKGERTGVREARKHIAWYTKGMHSGATVRNEVCQTETLKELMNIIDEYINYLSKGDEGK
ncbi:MAG: tRNA dihydrouridine synthase DusB [Ruminococcaceae bacterium]|nr:tRNA dihydrouridine synthase DusB [Oscillospiraceae bacterium]